MGINGLIRNAARDPSHGVRARRNAQQMATAPKALNPTSGQITLEVFVSGSRPAYGNTGRLIYISDNQVLEVDTGSSWQAIS